MKTGKGLLRCGRVLLGEGVGAHGHPNGLGLLTLQDALQPRGQWWYGGNINLHQRQQRRRGFATESGGGKDDRFKKMDDASVVPGDKNENVLDKYSYAVEVTEDAVARGRMKIDGWGHLGFKVNNEFLNGSLVVFPKFSLAWNVGPTLEDLREDDFALFELADPPLELIILGTGKRTTMPPKRLLEYLRSIAPVEFMDSINACATFNMLSIEERVVALAVLAIPQETYVKAATRE